MFYQKKKKEEAILVMKKPLIKTKKIFLIVQLTKSPGS